MGMLLFIFRYKFLILYKYTYLFIIVKSVVCFDLKYAKIKSGIVILNILHNTIHHTVNKTYITTVDLI